MRGLFKENLWSTFSIQPCEDLSDATQVFELMLNWQRYRLSIKLLQTTGFRSIVSAQWQCSDGKLLIDTSQTFSETFQLLLIQTNRTSELLASQLVFLISRESCPNQSQSERQESWDEKCQYSQEILLHFLPVPNHIDVTTPDSREQGVMAGGWDDTERCDKMPSWYDTSDEPDTAPGPGIIFQWTRIPDIAATTSLVINNNRDDKINVVHTQQSRRQQI